MEDWTASWETLELTGTAAQIHEWEAESFARRLNVCRPSEPALVLGSTQPQDSVDEERAARLGLSITRRRSGGGAVLLRPGSVLWVNVDLPRQDPLWSDDVSRSFWWLGHVWAEALRAAGAGDVAVHTGAPVRTEWAPIICFAGLGAGEVQVAGRKAVGLSQRRRRHGATFHCAALLEWDPTEMAGVVRGAPEWLPEALATFAGPCGVTGAALLAELRTALANVRPPAG